MPSVSAGGAVDDLFDVVGDIFGSLLSGARGFAIALVVLAVAVAAGVYIIPTYVVEHSVTCTVQEKSFSSNSSGSLYRISTKECGVLSVGDNLFKSEFASADLYYSIHKGKTYNFTYTGYRIPVLSAFPTIFKVEPVAA